MKNLIILFITIIVSISCKKHDPSQDFTGTLSVRLIDKNNENGTSYATYKNITTDCVNVETGKDGILVVIGGSKPQINDLPYFMGISLVRKSINNINKYRALESYLLEEDNAFNIQVQGDTFDGPDGGALTSANSQENLTITKDDATTLEGTFRVRISDFKQPNPTIREMEGFFSIPKKGRF